MSVTGTLYRGVVPSATNAIAVVTATVTVAGTWYQLIASTSSAIYVTGIVMTTTTLQTSTVDVGTGAAASEAVAASAYAYFPANTTQQFPLTVPLRIPAGTRVAIRASGSGNATCGITYVTESAVV